MANVDGQKPPPETLGNIYTLIANWGLVSIISIFKPEVTGFTVLTDPKPANNMFIISLQ